MIRRSFFILLIEFYNYMNSHEDNMKVHMFTCWRDDI